MSAKAVATHLVAHKKLINKSSLVLMGGGVFYLSNENRTLAKSHKVAVYKGFRGYFGVGSRS